MVPSADIINSLIIALLFQLLETLGHQAVECDDTYPACDDFQISGAVTP
jgi:hypothetical protein